jgi:hypothetical protein
VVKKHGAKNWAKCATKINNKLHAGLTVRSSKQCRARWLNHLNPELNKSKWTAEEDAALIAAHEKYGNKWKKIADSLHGRNENSVKNRFKSLSKKTEPESSVSRS